MANLILNPSSGFIRPDKSAPDPYSLNNIMSRKPLPEINAFAAQPGLDNLDKTQADFILQVCRKAIELFDGDNLSAFINANLRNKSLATRLHYEFLLDTVGFIKTGIRSVSITTWTLLLVADQKAIKKVPESFTYTMKSELHADLTICKWLSHEGGFQDLVKSMYIIFGDY